MKHGTIRLYCTLTLSLLVAGSGCSSDKGAQKPETGPDEVVAGPPGHDEGVVRTSDGGLGDVQIEGADRGEPVSLRFNFTPDDDASVLLRIKEPGESRISESMRYRMVVEEVEDGLRVAMRDIELLAKDDSRSASETAAYANEVYAEEIGNMAYAVIVDENSGIVRTEGVERATGAMQRMFMPEEYRSDPQAKRLMRAYTDASHVEQMPRVNWVFMVQVWADQDLKIGEKKTAHFESYFPTASQGYHRATINVEYMAAGKVPCTSDASERDCVRLRLNAVPRPEELTLGVRRFTSAMVSAFPKERRPPTPQIESFESEMDIDVVLDPDTLRPYRFLVTSRDRLVLPGGEVSTTERQRETIYEY